MVLILSCTTRYGFDNSLIPGMVRWSVLMRGKVMSGFYCRVEPFYSVAVSSSVRCSKDLSSPVRRGGVWCCSILYFSVMFFKVRI